MASSGKIQYEEKLAFALHTEAILSTPATPLMLACLESRRFCLIGRARPIRQRVVSCWRSLRRCTQQTRCRPKSCSSLNRVRCLELGTKEWRLRGWSSLLEYRTLLQVRNQPVSVGLPGWSEDSEVLSLDAVPYVCDTSLYHLAASISISWLRSRLTDRHSCLRASSNLDPGIRRPVSTFCQYATR